MESRRENSKRSGVSRCWSVFGGMSGADAGTTRDVGRFRVCETGLAVTSVRYEHCTHGLLAFCLGLARAELARRGGDRLRAVLGRTRAARETKYARAEARARALAGALAAPGGVDRVLVRLVVLALEAHPAMRRVL